jgi:hypothetical protein
MPTSVIKIGWPTRICSDRPWPRRRQGCQAARPVGPRQFWNRSSRMCRPSATSWPVQGRTSCGRRSRPPGEVDGKCGQLRPSSCDCGAQNTPLCAPVGVGFYRGVILLRSRRVRSVSQPLPFCFSDGALPSGQRRKIDELRKYRSHLCRRRSLIAPPVDDVPDPFQRANRPKSPVKTDSCTAVCVSQNWPTARVTFLR